MTAVTRVLGILADVLVVVKFSELSRVDSQLGRTDDSSEVQGSERDGNMDRWIGCGEIGAIVVSIRSRWNGRVDIERR